MPQIIRKAREYDSVTGKRLESSDLTQVFNVELKRARRDEHERQARIKYSEQPRNSQVENPEKKEEQKEVSRQKGAEK